MAKTVAIFNQKGGVGKTTSAVNLSCSLARAGFSVLGIDLDPQANLTIGMGLDPEELDPAETIAAVLLSGAKLKDVIRETHLDNLHLVPSTLELASSDAELNGLYRREERLERALKGLRGYDYILIDCQPTISILPQNAIVAASHFLIPCDPGGFSKRGIGNVLAAITKIKESPKGWDYRVFRTKIDNRNKTTKSLGEDTLKPISKNLLKTVIHFNTRLEQVEYGEGCDVMEFDASSRAASDYEALQQEVRRIWR